jgi:hypothetical protein
VDKSLAETRRHAALQGWCYQHVQAIIVAIDQYAEARGATLGNPSLHVARKSAVEAVKAEADRVTRRTSFPSSARHRRPVRAHCGR